MLINSSILKLSYQYHWNMAWYHSLLPAYRD
jgi:hypothetical protein